MRQSLGRDGFGGAVVLAAGASRRFGGVKLLVPVDGEPLLLRTVRVVAEAGFRPVVVVLGAHGDRLRPLVEGRRGVETIDNPRWASGMGTSVAAGVAHLLAARPELPGALILPADLPGLDPVHLRALPRAADASGLPMAAVTWPGAPLQAPAWFSRAVLPELLELHGDRGARAILRARSAAVAAVSLERPLRDLDRRPDR